MKPLTASEGIYSLSSGLYLQLIMDFSGLVPNEDAPDITANTFLADITPEELAQIGRAFLSHREGMKPPLQNLCVYNYNN